MARDNNAQSLASLIMETLHSHGTRRMFGIPGGGSSLELMEAAGHAGIEFILARTENAAAIMAAVTGEITGTPGAVLAGVGPGAASIVNGIAYAHLEKSPLVLITDGPASSPHQAFDQNALFAPITKMQGRLRPESGAADIRAGIRAALTPSWGPVHFDLTAGGARAPAKCAPEAIDGMDETIPHLAQTAKAVSLVTKAQRPIILAGLEARHGKAPKALRQIAEALSCPVLLTYKAKGVLPDDHGLMAGNFTGALAESGLVHSADLIITFGFDRIEMIPGAWPYDSPLLELTSVAETDMPVKPVCRLPGPLHELSNALLPHLSPSAWTSDEISCHADAIAQKCTLRGTGHTAQSVTQTLSDMTPPGTRLTVDAGAHMFSALSFWKADEPYGVLKSNGLSTMGYALPAAIASSLQEPRRRNVAISGDGGVMMCLGELATALEHDCNIILVVINDASLSLIDIKQQRQQYGSCGVRTTQVNFAQYATALGCAAWRVGPDDALEPVVEKALATKGPAVIDVICDSDGYGDQIIALRG